MCRLIPRPRLDWDGDTPADRDRGDVYFSRADGLAEAETVFLGGCGWPDAPKGRAHYCVGELGFGSGLNLLAMLAARAAEPAAASARLDLLSFDSHLMRAEEARRVHRRWPRLAAFSDILVSRWPPPVRGVHQIDLDTRSRLTLFLGDVARMLPVADAIVDAWFLDGFSPARNPAMWTPELFAAMARLSAPAARVATWCAAGAVRRGLEEAGFAMRRRPGHGNKRHRLEGVYAGTGRRRPVPPRSVMIVGAGIAGAACARAFAHEGCAVTVLEAREPASGASGHPLALASPRLDAVDTPTARLFIGAGLLAASRFDEAPAACARRVELIHLARTPRMQRRFVKLAADPPLPESLLRFDRPDRAKVMAHLLRPLVLIRHWLRDVELRRVRADALVGGDPATMRLTDGTVLRPDVAVIACGAGVGALLPLPHWRHTLGQMEIARLSPGPASAIKDNRYVLQWDRTVVCGAGFVAVEPGDEARVERAATEWNLRALERLRPDLARQVASSPRASRAGVRVSTPDRIPVVGPVLGRGVFIAAGFGARGMSLASFAAACLAAEVCGRPVPAEIAVRRLMLPGRYPGSGRSP